MVQSSCESKVTDFDFQALANENVGGLDVPVDEPNRVHIVEGAQHLVGELDDMLFSESDFVGVVQKTHKSSWDGLHHDEEVQLAILFDQFSFDQLRHVRALQYGELAKNRNFTYGLLECLSMVLHHHVFDGHILASLSNFCKGDLSISTLPQRKFGLVFVDQVFPGGRQLALRLLLVFALGNNQALHLSSE
uniref:Uncharacterized protein n=1 Tax=Strombidium inclinatum TaxID=197538 RepID=A0A7S3MU58_9SPIT